MSNSSVLLKYLVYVTCCIMVPGFYGCSHTAEIAIKPPPDKAVNVEYSVIYYIHADADYLFHDSDGVPVRANSQVLETALDVAEQALSGEVFIFYQRPEKKTAGLFPRRSSQFFHFTNGKETSRVRYRHPVKNEAFLTTEAQLYKQYRNYSPDGIQQNYFLYFGHEIPNDEGKNYHRTLPDLQVNTESFAAGIQHFLLTDDQRFNLVVISACNNGNPAIAEHLMPFTDYLLASPQNLHLSHIDSDSISLLEGNPEASPRQVAYSMAGQTFQRQTAVLQTEFTLALYDFEYLQEYLSELYTQTSEYDVLRGSNHFLENIDCAQFSFFDAEKYKQGVETWYKPARFGRQAAANTHSGWGCKPLLEN